MTSRRDQALARIGVVSQINGFLIHDITQSLALLEKVQTHYIEALTDLEVENLADEIERIKSEHAIIAGHAENVISGRYSWW